MWGWVLVYVLVYAFVHRYARTICAVMLHALLAAALTAGLWVGVWVHEHYDTLARAWRLLRASQSRMSRRPSSILLLGMMTRRPLARRRVKKSPTPSTSNSSLSMAMRPRRKM